MLSRVVRRSGPSAHGAPRRSLRTGFTILEILIAIVILVIGITGIVALFPTAIESGNKTVEDSYAAAITQSVIDAISVGLRESKYSYQPGGPGNPISSYFILDHDGVLDAAVPDGKVSDYTTPDLWKKDYVILLPKADKASEGTAGNTLLDKEPIYTYPTVYSGYFSEAIGPMDDPRQPNASGFGSIVVDDQANIPAAPAKNMYRPTYQDRPDRPSHEFWYRRVYPLGRYREGTEYKNDPAWKKQIRMEFLGQRVVAPGVTGSESPNDYTVIDPYPQYSFAIAIQRAKIDNSGPAGVPDGRIGPEDRFSDNLFQVRIVIFRNFDASEGTHKNIFTGGTIPKTNVPIREFVTLMSI